MKIARLVLGLACAVTCWAQVGLLPMPHQQFLDANGYPLAGGKLYTYTAGTSTPLATYTDSTGTVANANPVVLDAGGFANIWLSVSVKYKFVLTTAAGVQVWTADNIGAPASAVFTQVGSSVTRSVQSKLQETVSVKDFGAKGDGTTDDTAAFNAALTSTAAGVIVNVPPANYVLNGVVNIGTNDRLKLGAGSYTLGNNGKFELSGSGSSMECVSGPDATTIWVPQAYAVTDGVIKIDALDPAGSVSGCGIIFFQPPAASTRAAMVHYAAYAIYADNAKRVRISHMKIMEAWNGLNLRDNTGGANVDDVELSSYNYGIDIDGALDTVRIDKLHWWPFGINSTQLPAFEDPASIGINAARVDGLMITNGLFIGGTAINYYASSNGCAMSHVSTTGFDGNNGVVIACGDVTVGSSYFSVGDPIKNAVYQTGGNLSMSAIAFGQSACNSIITIAAGTLRISASKFSLGQAASQANGSFIYENGTSADMRIEDSYFDIESPFDKTLINLTAGYLTLVGNRVARTNGVYSTALVDILTNAANALVADNTLQNFTGSATFVHVANSATWTLIHDNMFLGGGWTNSPSASTGNVFIHDNH